MKRRIVSKSENHLLSESGGKIELWMTKRLRNEPNDSWMQKARTCLRKQLKTLKANSDEIIEGIYISRGGGGHSTDVDNVLFYNVRGGYFKESSQHGLRFCYLDEDPPPSGHAKLFAHYQSYKLVNKKEDFSFLRKCRNVASYEFCTIPSQDLKLKEDIWWGSMNTKWNAKKGEVLEKFALRVCARYPQSRKKQYVAYDGKDEDVFDGIASAMHVWSNEKWVDEVAGRVANAREVSCESVRAKLQNKAHAFLGENKNQRWDPADDRCIAGELLLTPNTEDKWRFKVKILAVG